MARAVAKLASNMDIGMVLNIGSFDGVVSRLWVLNERVQPYGSSDRSGLLRMGLIHGNVCSGVTEVCDISEALRAGLITRSMEYP